ncbi:AraC family transcriptional regulator [Halobacillus rhizosphaerae]|uniref:AraC family transcriptional regulator n=1 Tax=Halobacillus rhizosphaerae TaxID=3064889 RepID=UPI00398A584A
MNYLECIQRTIDYIEENLHEKLTLENLAEIAHFSPFHFHRLFQAMVGVPVMDYVRKRRMTKAAERLFYTDDKIITIALDAGFQYQESFHRSFKKIYGVSPKQYRNAEQLRGPFRSKACLSTRHLSGGQKMEPKFLTKPAFHIIGYELKTKNMEGQNNNDIPQFWQQYIQNRLGFNIPHPLNNDEELGICTDFSPETGEFVYIIGMEVKEGTDAPDGLVYRSFPQLEYVVFTTPQSDNESFPSTIQSTWNYIFSEWFPESNYEHRGTLDFELYDQRCYGHLNKQMDIYIPIKKRLVKK